MKFIFEMILKGSTCSDIFEHFVYEPKKVRIPYLESLILNTV